MKREEDAGGVAGRGTEGEHPVSAGRDQLRKGSEGGGGEPAREDRDRGDLGDVSVLDGLGTDLLKMAGGRPSLADGKLWLSELTRIKEILERKERHTPVLIGPRGVGKRGLAVILARDIERGDAPRHLLGRRLIELPFHRVLAASNRAGDFERLVFAALREAGSRDDVIVLMSGLTNFLGNFGGRAAPVDASYVINTACHQPNIYMMGTATPELYRETVKALPWCLDAMTRVEIAEPDRGASVHLLSQIVGGLEEYHGVAIREEAVRAAVDLSADYMRDQVLPGKAYRLLDDAAAREATAEGEGSTAAVTEQAVRRALSDIIGIPESKLAEPGRSALLDLETALERRVKGQSRSIRTLADVIRVTMLNLDASPSRPNGVFLFVGPPGVGKSELARALAEELYGRSGRLFEFNMARYSGDDGVLRLVGASLGDAELSGDLTTAVARSPHSVVLLEHIERSHKDVAVLLMQIFRDGSIVDGQGSVVSFSNATVVMTTSAEQLLPPAGENGSVGFSLSQRDTGEYYLREAREAIEQYFPADFMEGIDEVLLFDPLTDEALREIAEVRLDDIRTRLGQRSIELEVTDGAMSTLVEKGASRQYGARNLGRTVERLLLKPIARYILAHPEVRRVVVREIEGDLEVSS
ncbi:MAG: AAA domain-containing protein [Candidatus Eisenbacteria bacterium]|nr:AAA domain-containing protein [Candidatus Eisenbacteria bacterium]